MISLPIINQRPLVSIVGAGPGDPDLLTIKALKAIQNADVILYDALVNREILAYAKSNTKMIYVGKRKSLHRYSQDEINKLLVSEALKNQHVVRLKGGDPFVFGRGGEEALFIASHGIPYIVIPGISSSIAVPASAQIPVTFRGVSESFWVITATTSERRLSNDIRSAAKSNATIVILMGLGKLHKIVEVFMQEKKSYLPIAVLQSGTCNNEVFCIGTIATIEKNVKEASISTPATIVIGEVVNLQERLCQFQPMLNTDIAQDEFIYQNLDILPLAG